MLCRRPLPPQLEAQLRGVRPRRGPAGSAGRQGASPTRVPASLRPAQPVYSRLRAPAEDRAARLAAWRAWAVRNGGGGRWLRGPTVHHTAAPREWKWEHWQRWQQPPASAGLAAGHAAATLTVAAAGGGTGRVPALRCLPCRPGLGYVVLDSFLLGNYHAMWLQRLRVREAGGDV